MVFKNQLAQTIWANEKKDEEQILNRNTLLPYVIKIFKLILTSRITEYAEENTYVILDRIVRFKKG